MPESMPLPSLCQLTSNVAEIEISNNQGNKNGNKKPRSALLSNYAVRVGFLGAQERTRTSTPLRALGPEPSASTNSATWAKKTRII